MSARARPLGLVPGYREPRRMSELREGLLKYYFSLYVRWINEILKYMYCRMSGYVYMKQLPCLDYDIFYHVKATRCSSVSKYYWSLFLLPTGWDCIFAGDQQQIAIIVWNMYVMWCNLLKIKLYKSIRSVRHQKMLRHKAIPRSAQVGPMLGPWILLSGNWPINHTPHIQRIVWVGHEA